MSADPMTPGFRQGVQRQRGLASGREAPRASMRPSAWAEIQNDNGLKPHHPNQVWTSEGRGYDPDQGSLFDVKEVAPRSSQTDESVARSHGAPTGTIRQAGGISKATGKQGADSTTGLAGQAGFMPTLTRKQKVASLQGVADARTANNSHRGGGHFAEIMQDRSAASKRGSSGPAGHSSDWYRGSDDSIGSAPAMIQHLAARQGTSTAAMTRATALSSPQAGWQDDHTGEYYNAQAAKNSIGAAQAVKASTPDAPESEVHEAGASVKSAGGVLPENTGKAAVHFFRHGDNSGGDYPVKRLASQKAPNFEASLHMSHIDPAVRRIAATSWTVDRHDARVAGMDANSNEFQRRGVYEATAMTGRRQALKNRSLNPDEQAREWVGARGGGDTPQLFNPDTHAIPSKNLPGTKSTTAPSTQTPMSRTQMRNQSAADKFGLEF